MRTERESSSVLVLKIRCDNLKYGKKDFQDCWMPDIYQEVEGKGMVIIRRGLAPGG